MSQADVASLTDPTTELFRNVVVIHSPTPDGGIGIGIPAAALTDGRLWGRGLLDPSDYFIVPLEAFVADRMPLQGITPPLVFMKFGDWLDLTALVADACRHR